MQEKFSENIPNLVFAKTSGSLLDRKEVLNLRVRCFELMRVTGIVAEATDEVEGIYSGTPDQTELTRKLIATFVRDAAYGALCHSSRIWQFYEEFFIDFS